MFFRTGVLPLIVALGGCHAAGQQRAGTAAWTEPSAYELPSADSAGSAGLLQPIEESQSTPGRVVMASASMASQGAGRPTGLADLVENALAVNSRIRRLEAEARAAWARVPQVRALPDPMAGGTVFGEPMHMADGQARGTFMLSQTIPSLKKLDARGQQAAFEGLRLQQAARSARLSIAADVEEAWYRLYLLDQLLRINEANRQLISSLVDVATRRVEVGETSPGDVVLGTLELSRTEEERLMLQQQLASRQARLNRLLGRPSDVPLPTPVTIDEPPLDYSLEGLRLLAFEQQPEIVAARLQTQAAAWGVQEARLEGIPEVNLSYEHMFMRSNPGADASDPWQVGVAMNVPLWHRKYRAIEREAWQENLAACQGVEEAVREYDAALLDLLAQVEAAERIAELYRDTILPQARQALEVDQQAYGQGTVTFERVVSDTRNLLTAESAHYRAIVDRAIAVARIKQIIGGQLPVSVEELNTHQSLPTPYP